MRLFFVLILFGTVVGSATAFSSEIEQLNPALGSDYIHELITGEGPDANNPGYEMDVDVCETWNPEFVANGMHCCGFSVREARREHKRARCDARRNRHSYCSEVTEEERDYASAAASGKIGDLMQFLAAQVQHRPVQAFCSVNTGFLVRGRAILADDENGIVIRSPERCTNYGTEPMAAMLEWLGRQVKKEFAPEYPGIHFVIGDVSPPRGGCMASVGGRRGHMSHAIGEDADVGFVTPRKGQSPVVLHRDFQVKPNWWLLKQIFHNPYACIKVIFLDHRHIAKLARYAWNDPDWLTIRRFVHHVRGHRDHFHIRIGDGPGEAGCAPHANPEDELKMELENSDESDSSEGGQVE